MSEKDTAGHAAFRARFEEVIAPIHADFNAFLAECGEAPYKLGEFFEASPHMNMMLYPAPLTYAREKPLAPARFQYLEGCVRQDDPYEVPDSPEVRIDTTDITPDEAAQEILLHLQQKGYI